MADTLAFDVLARDRASATFHKIDRAAAGTGRQFSGLQSRVGTFSRVGSRAMSVFSTGVFALAAGVGVGAVAAFKGFIGQARESEKVSASTAQGIKTIGASSWTSVAAIEALADTTSKKIGVDDELIQTSANLLLTFKNIKNVAGENNDIFNRSVVATQDLAAKGFGSAESAAKMLGKALNDPVKGMTALGRAGVTFSQKQKTAIARLVETGDILGAQKIILKEVEAQVGGTAEATATNTDRMKVAWENLQESIGKKVLPALDTFAGVISGDVIPAITDFDTWLNTADASALGVADTVLSVADVMLTFDTIVAKILRQSADNFLRWAGLIIHGAANAFGWVPGVGPKLKTAAKTFDTFSAGVLSSLDAAIAKSESWDQAVDRMRKEVHLKADIRDLQAKIATARSELKDPNLTRERKAKLTADIRSLQAQVAAARAALASLQNRTVTVTVQTRIIGGQGVRIGERTRQHGGPVWPGGAFVVGETRPELFVPDRPGRIVPRVPTGRPAAAAGGGIDERALARAVAQAITGATLIIDARGYGRLQARTADLYARAG